MLALREQSNVKAVGMPTLYVYRHAKSSWAEVGLRDFDRPLANRGLKAAPVMGAEMAKRGVAPEFILCSTSRRTRETLGLTVPHLSGECRILLEDGLYEAHDEITLLERMRRLPATIDRAMVIGHNPIMHDIAATLVGDRGDPALIKSMRQKFPTAALAVIDLDDTPWAALAPGVGRLETFITPRDLQLLAPERRE